jgi:hypothetical protein
LTIPSAHPLEEAIFLLSKTGIQSTNRGKTAIRQAHHADILCKGQERCEDDNLSDGQLCCGAEKAWSSGNGIICLPWQAKVDHLSSKRLPGSMLPLECSCKGIACERYERMTALA